MTQRKFQLDEYAHGMLVVARRDIRDNPLSQVDSSAKAFEMGRVADIDFSSGLLMVDFGKGAIACDPGELYP